MMSGWCSLIQKKKRGDTLLVSNILSEIQTSTFICTCLRLYNDKQGLKKSKIKVNSRKTRYVFS